MAGGAGGGRRLILSLFKITSTHCAESLERHCLGFCISLKNIPLQSFPSSEAHPFPHSGPLKGSCVDPAHGYSLSRASALPLHLPDNSDAARVCSTFTRQPELRGRWSHLPQPTSTLKTTKISGAREQPGLKSRFPASWSNPEPIRKEKELWV